MTAGDTGRAGRLSYVRPLRDPHSSVRGAVRGCAVLKDVIRTRGPCAFRSCVILAGRLMSVPHKYGGPADDGNGSGDITAAVKVNGSLGATKYGVFIADEAEEVGRSFGALRLVRDFGSQNLGSAERTAL